jgi:outer membrane protein assembly factor BamE
MPAFPFARATFAALACVAVAACGSFDSTTYRIASAITPYKVEIVQGNFVSKEQVEALKPGMARQQVRDILGTPLVTDAFHSNRWDYVFTIRRQGVEPQKKQLTVFFNGEVLDRFEGDEMPSEADFVATLDNKRKGAKVPQLEATEEQLKQFETSRKERPARAPEAAAAPAAPGPAASYPPLEPTR